MKKIFILILLSSLTISCSAQTILTEAQIKAKLTTTSWPYQHTNNIIYSLMNRGVNTYTANTSFTTTGTFGITSTGLFTIASTSLTISGTTIRFSGAGTPGSGKVLQSDANGYATWQTPTAGTVTSVSAISPLSSSGGATPTITITSPLPLASGGTNADLSATGGTSQVLKQSSSGAAITVGQLATSNLSDVVGWTDYSGTSTIVGWSSFSKKFLQYSVVGKVLHVWYNLNGTSDNTVTSFTIPYTAVSVVGSGDVEFLIGTAMNNTVYLNTPGTVYIADNTSVVIFHTDVAHSGWTGSGTKIVSGFLTIPIQ